MNVLVTGCAGFIGWRVSALLLAERHRVTGIDNLCGAYDPRIKRWRLADLERQSGFTFHLADICEPAVLKAVFAAGAFDAAVHLAARAGVRPSVEDPWAYLETNVTGTLNLFECCRRYSVGKFVLASTSSLYGDGAQPFREDSPTDRPLSPYAASKKAAEALCHTYHHIHRMDVLVLRYFTVYGPAGRPDMSLFRFVQRVSEGLPVTVYGDGSQTRDFAYVEDVAQGTLSALRFLESRRNGPVYEVINLGSDRPVAVADALRLVERLVGRPAKVEHKPRHPADPSATWADISKARRLLGWAPATPFEEGLERTVEWYRQNRDWASRINTGEGG